MTFDYMATLAGVIYSMGIVLHYFHVLTVFHLLDCEEDLNRGKVVWNSIIWPVTVFYFAWEALLGDEEDD